MTTDFAPQILAYGDSLTAGYGLPARDSFAGQLERALRDDGIPATVHNAGVSGDTSGDGLARLPRTLSRLTARPDLVILELGANDMLRGISPARTRANLDQMMAEFDRLGFPVLLAGMMAPPILNPAYRAAFDSIFPELAAKYRAPLYPFFMAGLLFDRSLHLPDRVHPNAKGVGVIVRGILPSVKMALARERV